MHGLLHLSPPIFRQPAAHHQPSFFDGIPTSGCKYVCAHMMQVEAADRMDVDLTQEGASQCFSLVDDIVAWVENPAANRPLALPSCQHK